MNISEQTKRYVGIYTGVIILIGIIYFQGKEKKFSCDDWANDFKKNFMCSIILTGKNDGTIFTTLTGVDLKTKKIVDCKDDSKWLRENFVKFEIGDTIIKEKNRYTIHIRSKMKKNDLIMECNGKLYLDQ